MRNAAIIAAMRKAWKLVFVAAGTAALGACASDAIDGLEAQARRVMISNREAVLGIDPDADPRPVPDATFDTRRDRSLTRTLPPTNNPSAGDLPVERARGAAAATRPSSSTATQPATQPGVVHSMGLADLLRFAIEHSPDYRTKKEELFLTTLDLLVQRHLWGPRFFSNVTASAASTPAEAGDHEQAMTLLQDVGVTQKLPFGGSVSAKALVSFVDTLREAGGGGPDGEVASGAEISAVIPLLRGAGDVAREELIQSERDLVYATRAFERYRREFLLDISTRYYDVLRQQSEVRNRKVQLANFEALERRTQALADAGRTPPFEVSRTQQRVLFARNNLVAATELLEATLDNFKLVIGMPVPERLDIQPTQVVIPEPVLDPVASIQNALKYRLDLQTLADRVDDARRGVENAKNGLLPDLNVSGRAGLDSGANKSLRVPSGDLDKASYEAAITLGLPLDRKIEEINKRKAMTALEQAQRTHTRQRDFVALRVRQSIRQITLAKLTLELQSRNIAIADQRLKGLQLRERTVGPREFIEAQEDLLDARNRYNLALRDLRVSILQYLLDTDQLRVAADGTWRPPAKLVAVETEAAATQPAASP